MNLNLGCGRDIRSDFVNVDKYHPQADINWDLEKFPWPWKDDSVHHIVMRHVLEHLGQDPNVFIGVMKELYRVCKTGAKIEITVPHPRHDDFLGDPTHVRPINIGVLSLFCKRYNEMWDKQGDSNSLLALYHKVDFEIVKYEMKFDKRVRHLLKDKEEAETAAAQLCNVVQELVFELEVKK
jgi:predicted SAM-dependent methyltransferase